MLLVVLVYVMDVQAVPAGALADVQRIAFQHVILVVVVE